MCLYSSRTSSYYRETGRFKRGEWGSFPHLCLSPVLNDCLKGLYSSLVNRSFTPHNIGWIRKTFCRCRYSGLLSNPSPNSFCSS